MVVNFAIPLVRIAVGGPAPPDPRQLHGCLSGRWTPRGRLREQWRCTVSGEGKNIDFIIENFI